MAISVGVETPNELMAVFSNTVSAGFSALQGPVNSVFGLLIALIACHFGLKVRPNTESLSARTTSAVVTAITVVIIVDALFAILTRNVGMPGV